MAEKRLIDANALCRYLSDWQLRCAGAVKLRKMTDDKLVEHIDHIREEAYNTGYSEAEAQRASTPAPGKTLPQLLEQLDAGECKGIKSATAYKIAEFAREQGYLE